MKAYYWREKHDDIIIKCVKAYPYNITSATVAAACLLDRTPAAVRRRYYSTIKGKTEIFGIFSLDGKKNQFNNVKNLI